jgi:hypothetical protein
MICQICGVEVKNFNSLGKHLFHSHKDITKEEYYGLYISEVSDTCECGEKKKFRGLGEGYRRFCSSRCASNNEQVREANIRASIGKKQSQETIDKRIANTDQAKKEHNRKTTMVERYGVEYSSQIPEAREKISGALRGRKAPRKPGQQEKIVASKKKNKTTTHKSTARAKISESLNRYYQNGEDQSVTLSSIPSNGRGHKTGFHKGILYRSSYELAFIIFCEKNSIDIESCENKERRVRYVYNGKKHWYYPDFYLTAYDTCVEIKPTSMMNDLFHTKREAGEQAYSRYVVLTENELCDEEKLREYFPPIQ